MPIPPPNGTYSTPELGIGNSESQLQKPLFVGDSLLNRTVAWELPDPADCDLNVPADFTDFIPAAEILDSVGTVVETITVTPAIGDATGLFTLNLIPAQTTTALSLVARSWRFRISTVSPPFQETLIIAPFELRTV